MKPLLTFIVLFLLVLPAIHAKVVINEIMYSPVGNDENLEWIELYNDGDSPVGVASYKIDGNDFDDATMQPRAFLVVARQLNGNESFASVYGNKDGTWNTSDDFAAVDGNFVLTNTGKTINLTDNTGMVIDSITYTGDLANDNGKTLERTNPLTILFRESTTPGGTPGTKNSIFNSAPSITVSPDKASLILGEDKTQLFTVAATDAENNTLTYLWTANGTPVGTTSTFTLNTAQLPVGKYIIAVAVSDGEFTARYSWNVTISNVPVSAYFSITYNASNGIDKATNVVFSNSAGRIDFGQQQLDLRDVVDGDAGIKIIQDTVGVDSSLFPHLSKAATVTLSLGLQNPVIVTHLNFTGTPTTPCTPCSIVNKTANSITFTVPSFSQYKAVEFSTIYDLSVPLSITLEGRKGQQASTNFTLKNTGVQPQTNVMLTFTPEGGYDGNLSADSTGKQLGPYTLASGESKQVTLATQITFSQDVRSTKLGTLTVTTNELPNKTIPVILSLPSKLQLSKLAIKVDDETKRTIFDSSILSRVHPGSTLSLEMTLTNTYTRSESIDISDISLEGVIKGLGKDGDDLDEHTTINSLQAADNLKKKFTLTIPIDAEDKTYQLLIQAKGVDEFNQVHVAKVVLSIVVEKDLHDLRIMKSEVSPQQTSCGQTALLEVQIKNVGRHDEDNVRLEVSNPDLGLAFAKELKLTDDSSKESSEYLYSTSLELLNKQGNYPITVRIYRNNVLDKENVVQLGAKRCETKTEKHGESDRIMVSEPFVKKGALLPKTPPAKPVELPLEYYYLLIGAIAFAFLVYLLTEAMKQDKY